MSTGRTIGSIFRPRLLPGAITALAAVVFAAVAAPVPAAAASNQCLSKIEIENVARMASVMGIGAALRRCGGCLGARYAQTLDRYEASHLLQDFRTAEVQFREKGTFDYADDLVRQAARNYSYDMSANCNACAKMADTIDTLSSPDARSRFYQAETAKITKLPAVKACP